jgi:hypothetical protein
MGTLFAFVLVCAGVLRLEMQPDAPRGRFRAPYINSKFIFPLMLAAIAGYLALFHRAETADWLTNAPQAHAPAQILQNLSREEVQEIRLYFESNATAEFQAAGGDLAAYFEQLEADQYQAAVAAMPAPAAHKYESGWRLFQHKIPMWLFILVCGYLAVLCVRFRLSLIPVLGLVFCFYMMAQIPAHSWFGFLIWLIAGLVIYFGYSIKNSKLGTAQRE